MVEEFRRQRLFQQVRAAVVPEAVEVVDRREDGGALRRRQVAGHHQFVRGRQRDGGGVVHRRRSGQPGQRGKHEGT